MNLLDLNFDVLEHVGHTLDDCSLANFTNTCNHLTRLYLNDNMWAGRLFYKYKITNKYHQSTWLATYRHNVKWGLYKTYSE